MNKQTANQMAVWLLKTHPEVFVAIAKKTGTPGLGALGQDVGVDLSPISTDDITAAASSVPDISSGSSSIFSSIGSGLSSAVSGVGNWLSNSNNVNALAAAASNYFKANASAAQANAQTAVMQTQLQRARAGLAPAPISYTAAGQPVYIPTAGQAIPGAIAATGYGTPVASGVQGYAMTAQGLQALAPSFMQQYGLYLALGGAALFVMFLLSSRGGARSE